MIEKYFISTGIQWVEIKEADLRILCGAPMDSIKHLKAKGYLRPSEIDGHYFEFGPNAILLSDLATQNGSFCNLSEFPVLHMIYKQGMGLKGHPNSTKGYRPLIMGSTEQVLAQQNYIFRGNTGLCTIDELAEAGYSGDELEQHWQLKLFFNGGHVTGTNELIDGMVIGEHEREIRNGVTIRRLSLNNYEISYKGESIEIDLNLKPDENYGATYDLGFHRISQEYFSIIHCGEGNGWDANRSCMGSIITFQNRIFLIDAGPHIDKIITSLGICNSQIDGIFQTHVHDDHFAGLTSLFQTGHKIKYYATRPVRHTVQKKFSALTGTAEESFGDFFEIHDLEIDKWNDIYGLDVMPLYSPHPLETTIFYFRAHGEFGDAVYGHLADIISKKNFKRTIETEKKEGISQDFFDKIWNGYSIKCDIKKIDGGLGFVHGNSKDFINDPSKKLLISHTDWDLSVKEREIGNNAAFGQQDILIPARVDYCELFARKLLKHYFPGTPDQDRELLINSQRVTFPPGTILLSKDRSSDFIYLILTGFVEYINSEKNIISHRSVGSILGEMSIIQKRPVEGTYRTSCYVNALKISATTFMYFINRSQLKKKLLLLQEKRHFILNHSKIGSVLNYIQLNEMIEIMSERIIKEDLHLKNNNNDLFLIKEGELDLYYNDKWVDTLKEGDPFGIFSILTLLPDKDKIKSIRVVPLAKQNICYTLKSDVIQNVPVLQWRYLELYKNRLNRK
jgi:hemerythrin